MTEIRLLGGLKWIEITFSPRMSRSGVGLPEIFIEGGRCRRVHMGYTEAAMRKKMQSFSDCTPPVLLMEHAKDGRKSEKERKCFRINIILTA